MLWDMIFGDLGGTLILAVGLLAALAALVWIPAPLKHYIVAAILILAMAGKVYSLGYAAAETKYKAELAVTIGEINDENEKAVIAAEAKVRAETAANLAEIKKTMEAQAAQAATTEASYQQALETITKAPADADGAAPDLILDAIRGRK